MRRSSPTQRRDLYAEVTQKLVAAIEAKPGEFKMPWRRSNAPLWRPVNALTQKPYRGINVIALWATAESADLTSNIWATYKQWQEIGAQVRKGEKSALIVKYGEYEVAEDARLQHDPDAGDEDDGRRLYLKGYNVFNARQVDGYELPPAAPSLGPIERIAHVEAFIAATKAQISIGGERAFYRPSTDTIHMPDEGLFTGTDSMDRHTAFLATELHELGHWTSHRSRLNRELGRRFADKAYIAEELIAETASAMLCATLGISQDVRPDHAQYLAHWLDLMKSDSKAIFTAAAAAARAVDYLEGLQPAPAPEPEAKVTAIEATSSQSDAPERPSGEPGDPPPPEAKP